MTFPPVLDLDWLHVAPELAVLVTAAVATLIGIGRRDGRATAVIALIGFVWLTNAMFGADWMRFMWASLVGLAVMGLIT